ncbi:hypothetical protein [Rhizobium leguminosarum]|uniref:hypothetical protein n=1 Tax=Rhizobium leguminosarum TaxID=384 RepID=UPI003F9CA36A
MWRDYEIQVVSNARFRVKAKTAAMADMAREAAIERINSCPYRAQQWTSFSF